MKKFVLIAFAIFLPFGLRAQEGNYKNSNYEGLHFLVGFMENELTGVDRDKKLQLKMFVTSRFNTEVMVRVGADAPIPYQVAKNSYVEINLPVSLENRYSEQVRRNMLVEVTSEMPVSVYAFSSIKRSSDSYSVIPISNWGNEYSIVSMPNDHYVFVDDSLDNLTPRNSEFMVMAAYDDTEVTIIPKALTEDIKQVDSEYKVTLAKGECYLVQSYPTGRGTGDLTGSVVRSDKPVGVLSGHVRTAVKQGFSTQPPDTKDHLCEMLMPSAAWGRTFISIPFGTSPNTGDLFKAQTFSGVSPSLTFTDADGQRSFNWDMSRKSTSIEGINTPGVWRSDRQVQLAQFMMRTGDDGENDDYDPSMAILPPVEQFISQMIIHIPDNGWGDDNPDKYEGHYVALVTEGSALSTLTMNGQPLTGNTSLSSQVIPSTNYHWDTIPLSPGSYVISSETGRFSGLVFGIGKYDSYAMVLGTSLTNPFTDDSVPPEISVVENCFTINGTITDEVSDKSFGIYYAWVEKDSSKNMNWKIDPVEPDAAEITFSASPTDIYKDGRLLIGFMDKNGNTRYYDYEYKALKLDYAPQVILNNLDWEDSVCTEYTIRNESEKPFRLESASINDDSRMTFYTDVSLPYQIPPGGEVRGLICFDPDGDSAVVESILELVFDCGIESDIPISGSVYALGIETTGLDFGRVRLGTEVCGDIKIINRSNVAITVTELDYPSLPTGLTLDTAGLFPRTLQPAEELPVKACLNPQDRIQYSLEVSGTNDFGIKNSLLISGLGVAPEINNLNVVFGSRRIGTANDTTLQFENTGNDSTVLNFSRFTVKNADDQLSAYLQNYSAEIDEASTADLSLSWTPQSPGDYSLEAEYATGWQQHGPVLVTIEGTGTIPAINTNIIEFADTEIYLERDSVPEVLYSVGNEDLTIDSIYFKSGDENSFEINYSQLINMTVSQGGNLQFPVKFKPEFLGPHEAVLGVMHDANPNYARSESEIILRGKGVPLENKNIEVSIEAEDRPACNTAPFEITIENKGNVPVDITGISAELIPDEGKIEIINFSPVTIAPSQLLVISGEVYTEAGFDGQIRIIPEFFGNAAGVYDFDYMPETPALTVFDIEEIKYNAGDTLRIFFEGEFPNATEPVNKFMAEINIREKYFDLIDENTYLELNDESGTAQYPLQIVQAEDKIEIKAFPGEITLDGTGTWKFDLLFLGLLEKEKLNEWEISVNSPDCFSSGKTNILTELENLCIFNLRHIKLITNLPLVNVTPLPAKEKVTLQVYLPEEQNAFIVLNDAGGQKVTKGLKINLPQGDSEVPIDLNGLAEGMYFITFKTSKYIINKKLIIIN